MPYLRKQPFIPKPIKFNTKHTNNKLKGNDQRTAFAFFLLTPDKYSGLQGPDTLYYHGLIAIEMANMMQYKDGGQDDAINIYNVSKCFGFVLFKDKITEKNYQQSFFPLGLCVLKASLKDVSDNNGKFYNTILTM